LFANGNVVVWKIYVVAFVEIEFDHDEATIYFRFCCRKCWWSNITQQTGFASIWNITSQAAKSQPSFLSLSV